MSNNIDEKVVSLKFQNDQFEENVGKSLSSIEKLKKSLSFKDGKTKGLDKLSRTVNATDFSGLESNVDKIAGRFTNLGIVGVTALQNITNRAIDTGVRLVKSLTVDPVKMGFDEYQLKMNSVRTIMASTGKGVEEVSGYLDELNKYADETIYSFSDMTSNIGKFTNAGVKLDTAVAAIKGVSNVAAVSGANANEASRAMYNFSQALSAGYVKLIDWKSIENANMATKEFKDQLIQSAVATGELVKQGDEYITQKGTAITATKNFNDSLKEGWMTTEVLMNTLNNYSTDVSRMSSEEQKAYREKLISLGYTEKQIKAIEKIGTKATDAAREVTTWTKLIDTLQEAVQSGWAKTFEIIFGDIEEAKVLWTGINDVVSTFIGKVDDARNGLLQTWKDAGGRTALIQGLADLLKYIGSMLKPIAEAFRDVFGRADGNRLADLTKNFANFTASLKLSENTITNIRDTFKGLFSVVKLVVDVFINLVKAMFPATKTAGSFGRILMSITGAIGRFLSTIIKWINKSKVIQTTFKYLGKAVGALSIALRVLMSAISLLIDFISTKTDKAFNTIISCFAVLIQYAQKGAIWIGNNLYNAVKAYAVPAFQSLQKFVGNNTSKLKEFIIQSRAFNKVKSVFSSGFDFVKSKSTSFGKSLKETLTSFANSSTMATIKRSFSELGSEMKKFGSEIISGASETVSAFVAYLKDLQILETVGKYITIAVDKIKELVKAINESFHPLKTLKEWLDPSTLKEYGKSAVQTASSLSTLSKTSMVASGSSGLQKMNDTVKNLIDSLKNNSIYGAITAFKKQILGLDMDKTIERGIGITKIYATVKLLKQSSGITKSISGMFDNVSGLIKGFTNTVNSFGTLATSLTALTTTVQRSLRIQMFKSIAIAIALMAGSLYIISKIPTEKLKTSMITLSIIVGLMIAILTKVNSAQFDPAKMQAAGIAFAALGASLMMVAISAKIFAGMKPSALGKAGLALTIFIAEIVAASRLCAKEGLGAATFIGLSIAISLLVPAIILMSKLPFETMAKGGAAIFAFIVLMGLAGRAASKDKVGMASFLGISTAVIALVPVILTLALLPFGKALKAATILSLTMIALGTAVRIASTNFDTKNTFMIVAMGATVGALTASLIALSLVPLPKLAKSVAALSATMLALAATARIMETQKKSIVSMTIIFGLIAGSVYLLSTIKTDVALQSMIGMSALLLAVASAFRIFERVEMSAKLIGTAITALGYIDLFIANFIVVAAAIGYLTKDIEGLKPAMERGIEVINLVGKFIGALINGLINGVLGNFGNNSLGAQFKAFSKDVTEALDNFKGIDSSTVSAAKSVAEALMYITAAEFLNNLNTPFLAKDTGMVHFVKQFKLFTDELAKVDLSPFNDNTTKQMTLVGNIIKGIGEAAMKIPAQGGLSGAISGSKDLGVLASQLFGDNGFVTKLRGYKVFSGMFGSNVDKNLEKEMNTVGNIIKALGSAAQKVPTGFSAKAILTGMPDMVLMAEQLWGPNGFMPKLTEYLNSTKNSKGAVDTGINSTVKNQLIMVADVVGALGEAAGKISTNIDPDSVKAVYTGAIDLVKFAEGIGEIGKVMPSLISNSSSMNEDAKARIILMTDVIKELAKAAKVIGDLGVSEIGMNAGSNTGGGGAIGNSITSLAGFAEKLKDFVPKFKEFATQAAQISEGDLKAGSIVATATKNLAYAAKAMEEGGAKVSTKDWENLAKGVKTFAKEINGIETEKLASNAKALSDSIKTVTKTLSGKETKEGFKSAGKASIDAYIKGLENVKADSMISKGNAVAKNFVIGLNQRKKGEGSAYNAGKNTVGWYKEAASKVDGVKKTGNEVAKKFVQGLNSRKKGEGSAWNSGKYTVYQYKEGAKAGKEDYDIYSIGQNIAEGLINGMNSKKEDAYNAGFSLGQQSAKGTKDGAKTNSPSKLTIPVGESIGEGLVVGMNSYANKVYKASSSMGETAALSVNSALGMNMMGDLGEPTIKPVIDLTNIERGARQIDGIITNSTGNINPYLLSQDINRQNGVNENMILANKIDKLASNISNTGAQQSTNYSIGDVTLEVSSLQDVTTLNQFVDIIKRAKAFN